MATVMDMRLRTALRKGCQIAFTRVEEALARNDTYGSIEEFTLLEDKANQLFVKDDKVQRLIEDEEEFVADFVESEAYRDKYLRLQTKVQLFMKREKYGIGLKIMEKILKDRCDAEKRGSPDLEPISYGSNYSSQEKHESMCDSEKHDAEKYTGKSVPEDCIENCKEIVKVDDKSPGEVDEESHSEVDKVDDEAVDEVVDWEKLSSPKEVQVEEVIKEDVFHEEIQAVFLDELLEVEKMVPYLRSVGTVLFRSGDEMAHLPKREMPRSNGDKEEKCVDRKSTEDFKRIRNTAGEAMRVFKNLESPVVVEHWNDWESNCITRLDNGTREAWELRVGDNDSEEFMLTGIRELDAVPVDECECQRSMYSEEAERRPRTMIGRRCIGEEDTSIMAGWASPWKRNCIEMLGTGVVRKDLRDHRWTFPGRDERVLLEVQRCDEQSQAGDAAVEVLTVGCSTKKSDQELKQCCVFDGGTDVVTKDCGGKECPNVKWKAVTGSDGAVRLVKVRIKRTL